MATKGVVWSLVLAMLAASAGAAPGGSYTVNGQPVAAEMRELLAFHRFAPGAYYIDAQGNFGKSGEAPSGHVSGGPPRGWSGQEPQGTRNNPYAQAYVHGVVGVRVFWVYSPSLFSEATGGSSGYVHICPNQVAHRSSEGATNVGGEYNSETGHNRSWAGAAGVRQERGRWAIEKSPNGPVLAVYSADGSAQRVLLSTMLQGRWTVGQTTYAVEMGKASC